MQISLSLFYIDNCADIWYSKGKYIMSFCNGSGRMKAGLPYWYRVRRRVGKSTIAEEFATNEYETHILVDFAACSTEIRDLFNDVSDLNRIFMRLQLEYGVELKERKSVIIFDEVQLAPKARQAIKYLVKDGRYDYIETGSLISIRKNVKDIRSQARRSNSTCFPWIMRSSGGHWEIRPPSDCSKAVFTTKHPWEMLRTANWCVISGCICLSVACHRPW